MRSSFRQLALAAAVALLATTCTSCWDEDGPATTTSPEANPGKRTANAVVFNDPFERIRIEAEAGQIEQNATLMRVVEDEGASGGKCIYIPDKVGNPEDGKFARAVYKFQVKKAAHYTFWCRRKWYDPPGCGDTLAVRIDKQGQPHKNADLFGADDSSRPPRWDWSAVRKNGKLVQYYLTAGEHALEILNREDGPSYDVILLTEDPDYVPWGRED